MRLWRQLHISTIILTQFDISLFKLTVTLNPIIYGVLIVILIWVSINVTNCSDGVDGLCGTLSAITLSSAYVLFMIFDIESSFRHTILIMVVCILGYLWFNASPSKLLMGDAGSRAIGIFIAFAFLKLHSPLLYIPLAIVLIIDGGLGLIKVSFMRFLHIKIMQNIRTPIHDHMRKNKSWSDAQVVFRICNNTACYCGSYNICSYIAASVDAAISFNRYPVIFKKAVILIIYNSQKYPFLQSIIYN